MKGFRKGVLLLALAWVALAPAAQGQDDDVVAYLALITTPLGAFVPLPTGAQLMPPQGALSLRYGRLSFDDDDTVHGIGVTAQFPAVRGLGGVTVGARVCSGCDPVILLGLDWTVSLSRTAFSDATLVIGLAPAIGVGILTSENANGGFLSAALAAPFTLVTGQRGGARVIPYVTPAIGLGTATADVELGGARPMVGGGLAIVTGGGVGVNAGFQKVFIDGGDSVIGLAISFGRSAR
jgi:hypothetical protein